MTVEIPLTKGYTAIVDDEDADLAEFKWTASVIGNKVYAKRGVSLPDGKRFTQRLHRVIMERILDKELFSSDLVDHVDTDGLNNTRNNLRLCTRAQNDQNRGVQKNSKSGIKGVNWSSHANKWRAQIQVGGKNKHLGYFDRIEDASFTYEKAAKEYFGEFARSN